MEVESNIHSSYSQLFINSNISLPFSLGTNYTFSSVYYKDLNLGYFSLLYDLTILFILIVFIC